MRKRTAAAGAGAVGLAAFGLWMLPDLGDFGLGGDGTTAGITLDPTGEDADELDPAPAFPADASADPAVADPADAEVPPNPAGSASDPAPGADDGPALAVADVRVDGAEYWVLRRFAADGREDRDPLTADEVVALARSVPGDSDGVKVRVSRTPDAEAGAADDLMDALAAAGLEDDEIDYRTRLVEPGGLGDPAGYESP